MGDADKLCNANKPPFVYWKFDMGKVRAILAH